MEKHSVFRKGSFLRHRLCEHQHSFSLFVKTFDPLHHSGVCATDDSAVQAKKNTTTKPARLISRWVSKLKTQNRTATFNGELKSQPSTAKHQQGHQQQKKQNSYSWQQFIEAALFLSDLEESHFELWRVPLTIKEDKTHRVVCFRFMHHRNGPLSEMFVCYESKFNTSCSCFSFRLFLMWSSWRKCKVPVIGESLAQLGFLLKFKCGWHRHIFLSWPR